MGITRDVRRLQFQVLKTPFNKTKQTEPKARQTQFPISPHFHWQSKFQSEFSAGSITDTDRIVNVAIAELKLHFGVLFLVRARPSLRIRIAPPTLKLSDFVSARMSRMPRASMIFICVRKVAALLSPGIAEGTFLGMVLRRIG